jgi:Na+-driven multidrug efflux pump
VIPIIALGASMVPFVGQNWGARLYPRVRQAQRFANRLSLGWCAICILVISGTALWIAPIFSKDILVQKYLVHYLWIMPLVFGFRGLSHNANSAMNAINQPYHSASHMLLRCLGLTLPLATLGGWCWGFEGILIGLVTADVLAGLLAMKWINYLYDHKAVTETATAAPSTQYGV